MPPGVPPELSKGDGMLKRDTTNNPIVCTCCKKELSGGIDTFGAIDTPMCWDCHSELLFNEGDPSPLAMWDGLREAIALEFP